MNGPIYNYVRGKGWVPGLPVEILATDGVWAVIRAKDVPPGVGRTGAASTNEWDPEEWLKAPRTFPYSYGPPKDEEYLEDKYIVRVKLDSL